MMKGSNLLEIKEIAINMMKLLKLHQNTISEFNNQNKLNRSETGLGLLYWLNDDEQKMVNEFQNKNPNLMVYHIIKTHTVDFGDVYDLLFVTDDEDFIEKAKIDLKDNLVLSHTVTDFPESGLILVNNRNGGITRVA